MYANEIDALEHCDPVIDLQSPCFEDADYRQLRKNVANKENQYPDVKIIDQLVYIRTEHDDGTEASRQLCWKLWIPVSLTRM